MFDIVYFASSYYDLAYFRQVQQEPIQQDFAGRGGEAYLSIEEDDIYCLTQAILIAMRGIR